MSINNIIFIKFDKKKKNYEVWYQPCADNEGLGHLQETFKTLNEAWDYATDLAEEYQVEYGINEA
jgi:hypothetical protein